MARKPKHAPAAPAAVLAPVTDMAQFEVTIEKEASAALHNGVLVLGIPRLGKYKLDKGKIAYDPDGKLIVKRFGKNGIALADTGFRPHPTIEVFDTATGKKFDMKIELHAFIYLDGAEESNPKFTDDSPNPDSFTFIASTSNPTIAITRDVVVVSVPVRPKNSTSGRSTTYFSTFRTIQNGAVISGKVVMIKLNAYIINEKPAAPAANPAQPPAASSDDKSIELEIQ